MDPDVALATARQAVRDLHLATSISQESDAAERLAEAFEALDGWMSNEGYLPRDWAGRNAR